MSWPVAVLILLLFIEKTNGPGNHVSWRPRAWRVSSISVGLRNCRLLGTSMRHRNCIVENPVGDDVKKFRHVTGRRHHAIHLKAY